MKALKIHSLALSTILLLTVCSFAQDDPARTITNSDLEKYRAARVKADEDYRQNYQRLGLSSPEELERREAERMERLTELSSQLEAKRRQREYLELLAAAAANGANNEPQIVYLSADDPAFYSDYSGGFAPFYFFKGRRNFGSSGDGFGPNVQMVRDQAGMFNSPAQLRNQNRNRRNGFRGNFGRRAPGRVFSPRR